MRRAVLLLGLAAWGTSVPALAEVDYPRSKRVEVVDEYHGTRVADPYRWLEDLDARPTRKWVEAQNELSRPLLAGLPERDALQARLRALWDYERHGVPRKTGDMLFFTRNDGLQNQPALLVQVGSAEPRVLLDPNSLAADGTVALTQFQASPDGRFLAYALARSGSDWNEIRIRAVDSGEDLPEVLRRVKFSNISWTRDNKGFFYSRYPASGGKGDHEVFEALHGQQLFYHRIGTSQDEDLLIYERPESPQWTLNGEVTDDGRFLMIAIAHGSASENRLHYMFLGNDGRKPSVEGPVVPLIDEFTASFVPIGNEGSVLYLLTDYRAPRKQILAIDLRSPARENWHTVIPEGSDVIDTALHAGRELILVQLHDATHQVRRYHMDGRPIGTLRLPGVGALSRVQGQTIIHGDPQDTDLFFGYTSFNRPDTPYRCDLRNGRCRPFRELALQFDPEDYVTEQVFYRSKDGTRVPMFITRKKSTPKSPETPALLYGYGGFEVALLPSFSVPNLAWMERGGIFVQANLRGGSEYGRAWYEAGTKHRKQNVFDDFIAAAEYLIDKGYTRPEHLAIEGRSNGGLLVGAVMNQRPELFAVGMPAVGVMDMLRFHKFTIGWAWTGDYGSSDNAKDFEYLSRYSPYHNIAVGRRYPAVLVTTADHDDRVVPSHSFKYVAALQAAHAATEELAREGACPGTAGPRNCGGGGPILIRVDVKAGHGAGKPTGKLIEEAADKLAFARAYTAVPGKH